LSNVTKVRDSGIAADGGVWVNVELINPPPQFPPVND
jgi:hypothetical protein